MLGRGINIFCNLEMAYDMQLDWPVTRPDRERSREELTKSVEECRARYQGLKTAGKDVTKAELFEGRAAYEAALVRLSGFFQRQRLRGRSDSG